MTWQDPLQEPPKAVVQQVGRWLHRVYISRGITQYGPDGYGWHVFGRRRAERKAARVLRAYLKQGRRRSNTTAVTVDDI